MRRPAHRMLAAVSTLLVLAQAAAAVARSDLKRGDPAPPLDVTTIDGTPLRRADLEGRILVILFGEAGQEKTGLALAEVGALLDSPRLRGEPITWVLVLSKGSDVDDLPAAVRHGPAPAPLIIHDAQRRAFGAYGIVVAPTAVIVDGESRIVHVQAGFTSRFGDIVFDALLLGGGRLTARQFEQTLHPSPEDPLETQRLRAERLVHFAGQLARRGAPDLAEGRYREALQLDPDSVAARLGLGDLLLSRGRLDEAERRFREVLAVAPASADAALGLASVWMRRDDTRLEEAQRLVEQVIERDPRHARAHFLLGLVHERRGDLAAAAAGFKRAAALLLGPSPLTDPAIPDHDRGG